MDVAWDNPTPNTYGKCSHNYFLLSDSAISDENRSHHDWQRLYPCTDTTYDTGKFSWTYFIPSSSIYDLPASNDGSYSAGANAVGMRHFPAENKIIIESATRPNTQCDYKVFCGFDPVDLPDYPASWDGITGTQFIAMLPDGRVGVRTEGAHLSSGSPIIAATEK